MSGPSEAVLRIEKDQAPNPEACRWLVDVLGNFPLDKTLNAMSSKQKQISCKSFGLVVNALIH